MEIPEDMDEALRLGLENEVKGREVYLDLASKAVNDLTRRVFRFIADQELLHIDKIKELADFLGQKTDSFDYDEHARKITREKIKELFGMDVKEMKESVRPETTDADAYEMGMQMEEESHRLYTELAVRSREEKTKKFFKLLAEEETLHHKLFKKALDFIKNPESWYAEEEGWILEG